MNASHQLADLRVPGLGHQRELFAPHRRAECAGFPVDGDVHGFVIRQHGEPFRQALVQLLLTGRLVERIESRAPHHRFADELRPGRIHRLQAGARRSFNAAAAQHRFAIEFREHRLVQLHVEVQHHRTRCESGAGRNGRIDDARDGNADAPRDSEQKPRLVQAHGTRQREHGIVACLRRHAPQLGQMRMREFGVRKLPFRRSGEGIERKVRPEAIGGEHGLQPRRGNRGLTDERPPGRKERNARACGDSRPFADRNHRRIDNFQADRRHRQRTWRFRNTRLSR